MDERVIIVFAKPAIPGSVKTRLVPPYTAEEAAEFHLAALSDVVAAARRAAGARAELRVAGGRSAVAEFRDLYPDLTVRAQRGAGLGERIVDAFDACLGGGAERALVVGSDHPTLPPEFLDEAFERLGSADIVFGPSRDGGYYLVAVRRDRWPAARVVFRRIPWSTPQVLDVSLERARRAGLEVALLPEWYDVDRAADLDRLRRDARPDSAAARFLADVERRRS